MSKLRVGILGCGSRGKKHGAAWQQLPDADLVALCDINKERLNEVGKLFDIEQRYTDYNEMFDREELDIVSVPARADWHFPLTMAVLEHGVSAVVEKPIAIDLEQADKMVEMAKEKDCLLAVYHQNSAGVHQKKAKALLASGAIGELRCIRAACKGYYGGFGMMETGTHMLDQVRNFGGEIDWMQGRVSVQGRDVTAADIAQSPRGLGLVAGDQVTGYYSFSNGVYGTIESFYMDKTDASISGVDLIGTEGMLCWRTRGGSALYIVRHPIWHLTSDIPWEEVPLTEDDRRVPGTDLVTDDAEVWMTQEMVNAIREKREHNCSGAAGRTVLEMIVGCYASHMTGARVQLPLEDRTHPLQRMCEAAGVPVPEFRIYANDEYMAEEMKRLGK